MELKTLKSDVDFWLEQFRSGTVTNEVRISREAAYRFFGTFPAMRSNILELWKILFARQITSLSDDELRLEIEKTRKMQASEPERSGSHVIANIRENRSGHLTGSLNPWQMACARVYDSAFSVAECMKELRAWAAIVLQSAVG